MRSLERLLKQRKLAESGTYEGLLWWREWCRICPTNLAGQLNEVLDGAAGLKREGQIDDSVKNVLNMV